MNLSKIHLSFVLAVLFVFLIAEALTSAGESGPADVTMIELADDAAQFWPRWRGPSGQGWVKDDNYPDRWSETENVLWKVTVPGNGNSSPIVWGNRIFLTTSEDGGKRRSILCFSRQDGRLLWQTPAPNADPEDSHRKNGHASSTPTTDGQKVYAYFGNHGLLAVDFNGKKIWHRELGAFNAYHGTASSPLLYRDRVILVQDHRGGSFAVALDKDTGKEVWRRARPAKVGWNSPIAVKVGKREEIVVSGQQQVIAYHPETGEELWRARGNTFEAIPTPVVGHGLVFCSSGRAGPTLAIRPGGSGDVTDSHIAWRAPKGSPFVPSTILVGDYLYMVNDMAAIATCYDAQTGKVMWQGRLGNARREGFSASPVVVGEKLFFTNDDGETFVLQAGAQFNLLHVNKLGERVLASPALVDGNWYFRTDRHLLAIGN
ncbi:PQQ-binding-like beta-propeller repeat protein [bacterium]|nr:PQQ-binding-like beta-propeller repeat protein [bacterium]